MNKELIKEKIRKQILMGGGETLVDAIYLILQAQKQEAYKDGYNQCLKDQKLTGEKHQHLYL